jgi:hypothetical protein
MVDVDFRLPPGISRASVLAKVAEIAASHPGTTFEELLPGGRKPPSPTRRTR